MQALQLRDQFGLDHLHLADLDPPEPGPGELLLEMKAASLNFRDLLMVRGHYNPRQPLPLVPCSDGVGVVLEAGAGVDGFEGGERVCPIFSQSWLAGPPDAATLADTLGGPLDGTLRERMTVKASAVVRVPEHLSDEQAATLPCAAMTAWSALVEHADLAAGDTVLTLGTGGVSIFALQLAKMMGATVIATSSSDEKLERVRSMGADLTINYRQHEDWGTRARDWTGGRGIDHVVEVGGPGTLAQSITAARIGGHISLIGVLTGLVGEVPTAALMAKQVRLQGLIVGNRRHQMDLVRAIDATGLRPVVDRSFALAEIADAFRHEESGAHFGKICLEF